MARPLRTRADGSMVPPKFEFQSVMAEKAQGSRMRTQMPGTIVDLVPDRDRQDYLIYGVVACQVKFPVLERNS